MIVIKYTHQFVRTYSLDFSMLHADDY